MRSNDALHLGLMLLALAASYLVPFELLLLAYVVLGPAHYFTEISWLHDRSYYLPHRGIAAALAIIAVVAALIDNASWFGFAMWGALIVCAMLAATTSAIESMLLFMVAIALSAIMYSSGSSLAVIGILIPTLIHVSLFTLIFMVLGAYRSGSRVQAALVVVYLARDRHDPAAAANGRNPDRELCPRRTGLFRQCRPGAWAGCSASPASCSTPG